MKDNDLFLSELMKSVDMRLFTPSLYQYFLDFLEIEKVRRYRNQFVINTSEITIVHEYVVGIGIS